MKREYQTTEFWAVVIGAILWLLDKWTGTNVLDVLSGGQALTDAKIQVAAIASSLREATGSDSDIIVYGAVAVYAGRKAEKIVGLWKRPGTDASLG